MRRLGFPFVLALLIAAAIPLAQTPARTPAPDAAAVLAGARAALGGDAKLSAVKTIIATGRTRQVRGDNLVPIEFEIDAELPDKYIRKDEVPAQESGPTTVGFNGDQLIQLPEPPAPPARAGVPAPSPEQLDAARRARVIGVKQDFARLMLGLVAGSLPGYPLTFTYVGQAEAPQGMADVVEAKGSPNLTMRLFVYRDTHLPVMVTWQGGGPGPGRGPGAGPGRGPAPTPGDARGVPPAPGGAPGAAPPPPENRLYFADYRDVDGLKWPFRIRRALGPDTIEETTFDRFRINARIDPKRFETRK